MPTKKKTAPKEVASHAAKPQFVTQVVEELPASSVSEMPVNEGVDVSQEALETIKEKAEQIEEVVEEIQEEQKEEKAEAAKEHEIVDKLEDPIHDEPENDETTPVEESPDDTASAEGKQEENKEMLSELFSKEKTSDILPESGQQKRIGAAPVFLWAVIIIGVALLTGGILLVVASGLPKVPSLFSKPTPTPTPVPTAMPTPAAVVRGDITVQVLNGGGTPGSASKAKALLEKIGYTVAATGNTDEYTYKKTEIHVKAGKEAYLELLKKDVASDYTLGTSSADLSADSSYDAQVIVGKE
ncbi:MAG: LytR C-terminal domain-containing protein [Candidatus Gottesmanbacteria bacterium]|nr:LytR C-terminal domain-containing protein [Candidatus Gottesmanbacteria bacterium]